MPLHAWGLLAGALRAAESGLRNLLDAGRTHLVRSQQQRSRRGGVLPVCYPLRLHDGGQDVGAAARVIRHGVDSAVGRVKLGAPIRPPGESKARIPR